MPKLKVVKSPFSPQRSDPDVTDLAPLSMAAGPVKEVGKQVGVKLREIHPLRSTLDKSLQEFKDAAFAKYIKRFFAGKIPPTTK